MALPLCAIPIIIFILLPITFLISYGVSVLKDHVYPLFPNISDTGTLPPESCIFSMLLNIVAAILIFAMYVRHKQIKEFFRVKRTEEQSTYVLKVNAFTSIIGYIACIGLDLIANFQKTNVRYVHDIGVIICFWCGTIYTILQSLMSFWMAPEMNAMMLIVVRSIFSILSLILVILNQTSYTLAEQKFCGNRTDVLKWNPNESGWPWHVTSSTSEWLIMIIFGGFILSYYSDFKKISLHAPEILMSEENPEHINIRSYNRYGFLH